MRKALIFNDKGNMTYMDTQNNSGRVSNKNIRTGLMITLNLYVCMTVHTQTHLSDTLMN